MTLSSYAGSVPDKVELLRRIQMNELSAEDAIALLQRQNRVELSPAGVLSQMSWQEHFQRDLRAMVAAMLQAAEGEIDFGTPVADLGLDSLSATEFSNRLRARWQITLQATAFFECSTLQDFYEYMLRIHGQRLREAYTVPAEPEAVAEQSVRTMSAQGQVSSDSGTPSVSPDPIRRNLQNLWRRAEEELESISPVKLPIDRILVERRGSPAVELCLTGSGKPPLLLLGGLMNPDGIWHRQLEMVSERFSVVAFNMPGCGRSAVDSKRLTLDGIVDDLIGALDSIRCTERMIVVGFSFGGILAQVLARRYPQRVAALALINSTARAVQRRDDIERLKRELEVCPEVQAINGEVDLELAAAYRRLLQGLDIREGLPEIAVPTLVLSATEDDYVETERAREMVTLLPDVRHVEIEGAGHFSLLTHSRQVNQALLAFMGTIGVSTGPDQ